MLKGVSAEEGAQAILKLLVEEGVVSERDLGIFRYVDSAAEGWRVVQEFYRERDEKAAR